MSFSDRFKIDNLPISAFEPTGLSPEMRNRARLCEAIKIQRQILAAEIAGTEFVITKNEKATKPRTFWMKTAIGLAFTPRFGGGFLFEKGQGVMVAGLSDMIDVLDAFETGVLAGEFDDRMRGISNSRRQKDEIPSTTEPENVVDQSDRQTRKLPKILKKTDQ